MLTYTSSRNLFGTLTGNNSSNLTVADTLINQFTRELVTSRPWNWRQKSKTFTTTASTQFYDKPFDCGVLLSVTITNGSTQYVPKEVASSIHWDRINQNTTYTSNSPEYYFPFGDQVGFYPIPSSSSLTGTFRYLKKQRDLSVADYTTGTITTLAAAGTTVTGSGTTWTSAMAGRYIKIAASGGGDDVWYEIESVASATSLTIARPYDGVAISAGSVTYIIGQVSIIPEDFQILPVYRALEVYFTSIAPDEKRATLYKALYTEGVGRMQQEFGSATIRVAV